MKRSVNTKSELVMCVQKVLTHNNFLKYLGRNFQAVSREKVKFGVFHVIYHVAFAELAIFGDHG